MILNVYNYTNQNSYVAQAGIKKGNIEKNFQYTQNVKLPDFHYNTIVSVVEDVSNNFIFFGYSDNPLRGLLVESLGDLLLQK